MPRSFSEKEVGEVIQRATQLHEERAGASDASLSLDELQRIGNELGLPAELVRAAALEIEARAVSAGGDVSRSITGAPFVAQQVRVLDGAMSTQEWGLIVADLQRETGSTGKTQEIGDVYSWERSASDMGLTLEKIHVSLESRDNQTTLEVRKYFGGQAFLTYVLAGALGFTLTGFAIDGAGFEFATNLALVGSGAAGGLGLARASMGLWVKRHRERLARLVDRVQRRVETSAATSSLCGAPSDAAPVVGIPSVDEYGNPDLESGNDKGSSRDSARDHG